MGAATGEHREADQLPAGDAVGYLLKQHAKIRVLFDEVQNLRDQDRREAFEELRALLVMHETAEHLMLRPVRPKIASSGAAASWDQLEKEVNEVLAQLQELDIDGPDFEFRFAEFESLVDEHAATEEHDEFPAVLDSCDREQRQSMGRQINIVATMAPTRRTLSQPAHHSTSGRLVRLRHWLSWPGTPSAGLVTSNRVTSISADREHLTGPDGTACPVSCAAEVIPTCLRQIGPDLRDSRLGCWVLVSS